MSLALPTLRRRLLVVRDDIDAAGGGAVEIHADGGGPPLAIIALPVPCMSVHATDAQMALSAVVGYVALGGVPTWARFVDGDGVEVFLCSAGLPGSGAQLIVTDGKPTPSHTLYVGGEITLSGEFTEPA